MSFLTFYELMSLKSKNEKKNDNSNELMIKFVFSSFE